MDSKLQYFAPEQFWKCFKLWGQPVNVREQQDAFEFFSNLTDQLDEFLKVSWSRQLSFTLLKLTFSTLQWANHHLEMKFVLELKQVF